MTTTYELQGLHCGSCITRVEKALRGLSEVSAATATLDAATVEFSAPVPVEALQAALAEVGMYEIREKAAA